MTEKLPFYDLPDDMTGMRVLDIGCCGGFFSFEAERRGATDIVAIDSFPESIRGFNTCRNALGSKANGYLASVYDLDPKNFGTLDLVMYFGVLYHLRHPLLSLQKTAGVTAGTILLQTRSFEAPGLGEISAARFNPFGIQSGTAKIPRRISRSFGNRTQPVFGTCSSTSDSSMWSVSTLRHNQCLFPHPTLRNRRSRQIPAS
jgi:SAM-dependent methyltransferase